MAISYKQTQSIYNNHGEIIFEGAFKTFSECLERAVLDCVDLNDADLSYKNLSNVCLDDAKLVGANFTGSNLSGANLSEANLNQASFVNASLYNSCFAFSEMNDCRFEGASFGGEDIFASYISGSTFDGESFLGLDFRRVKAMDKCVYRLKGYALIEFSRPPIVIRGLKDFPITIFDHVAHYQGQIIEHALLNKEAQSLIPQVELFSTIDEFLFDNRTISR